jgi:bifunctional DNA-binding transcriptional regulator/antitoxin component of YhaV-PrlF toxin-antitoxin module
MKRLINRRQQGDLGEASAVEWLTSMGATVYLPFGHSPDCDLVAEAHGRLLRIQVKTSTQTVFTPDGHRRKPVNLATNGGNQSWNRVSKLLDPSRLDYLFALTEDGRRWFIPSAALEAARSISLGGPKYSEYEIDSGRPVNPLVYGEEAPLESAFRSGEYPSGQRMAAVNRPPRASQVRILPPPFQPRRGFPESKYDRRLGRSGQTIINQKRRVTLPRHACIEAGLQDGDRLRVRSEGDGRLILERIEPPPTLPVEAVSHNGHEEPAGDPDASPSPHDAEEVGRLSPSRNRRGR